MTLCVCFSLQSGKNAVPPLRACLFILTLAYKCNSITAHYAAVCEFVFVTCDGRQGSGVGVGQQHFSFIWLRQVGVTAELLLLRQLEGDRDHTKGCSRTETPLNLLSSHSFPSPLLIFSPLSPPSEAHPFAVQRVCPLSFL